MEYFFVPMNSFVEHLFPLFQDLSPVKVNKFVKVPKTYQNMFSISAGFSYRGLSVCQDEKAKGITAKRYVSVKAIHTSQRNGPIIARYLEENVLPQIGSFQK